MIVDGSLALSFHHCCGNPVPLKWFMIHADLIRFASIFPDIWQWHQILAKKPSLNASVFRLFLRSISLMLIFSDFLETRRNTMGLMTEYDGTEKVNNNHVTNMFPQARADSKQGPPFVVPKPLRSFYTLCGSASLVGLSTKAGHVLGVQCAKDHKAPCIPKRIWSDYIPGGPMISIFEGQPLKTRPFF